MQREDFWSGIKIMISFELSISFEGREYLVFCRVDRELDVELSLGYKFSMSRTYFRHINI